MNSVICANIEIPLCFVQSISWGKKAKTYQHNGGYISARGFEGAEISMKISIDLAVCNAFGIDAAEMFRAFDELKTDRTAQSGVFYFAGFPIYPELEFALTNINKTEISDYTGKTGKAEADLVFSGVKAVKNVVRNRALELEPLNNIPDVVLIVDDKRLNVQDSMQINEFKTAPDSIDISISIGSDMDVISRDGFLSALIERGTIEADLPQGTTKYYVIQADLVEEQLTISGSVYPQTANQVLTKTYQNADLKDIINDICSIAGIDCECLVSGSVDYYRAFKTPLECLKDLQSTCGFIMSFRAGKLTIADVPTQINASYQINYIEMVQDSDTEPIHGCYWFDGINQYTSGTVDSSAIQIQACLRSYQDWAEKCLNFARYSKNMIVVVSDINASIDTHSAVILASNDAVIDCLCEWVEFDWINNTMQAELHYL